MASHRGAAALLSVFTIGDIGRGTSMPALKSNGAREGILPAMASFLGLGGPLTPPLAMLTTTRETTRGKEPRGNEGSPAPKRQSREGHGSTCTRCSYRSVDPEQASLATKPRKSHPSTSFNYDGKSTGKRGNTRLVACEKIYGMGSSR